MKPQAVAATCVELHKRIDGARTGWIVAVDSQGRVLVDYEGNPHGPIHAALMKAAGGRDWCAGQEVVLLFRGSASNRPVIVGLVASEAEPHPAPDDKPGELVVRVDGERVVVEGREEIVLQCGPASITLRRDGSIAIRGTTVESRSRYTNRIRGGTVEVN